MKKTLLSLTVAAVFLVSAILPATVSAQCAPGYVKDKGQCVNPGLAAPSAQMNQAAAQQKAAKQRKAKAEAAKRRAEKAKKDAERAAAEAERQRLAEAERIRNTVITTSATSAPAGSSADDVEAQEKVNKVEKGNIVIITYADDQQVDKKGNQDYRIGLVNVKVDRLDGDQKCSNRKAKTAKTNAKREMKDKEGKVIKDSKGQPVLFKGTANYRLCNAGKYKVTMEGRPGYSAVGKTTSEFTLKNDETQVVKFVIKKDPKAKKKPASTKTTLNITAPVVASRLF